jgi:hypothetical protein
MNQKARVLKSYRGPKSCTAPDLFLADLGFFVDQRVDWAFWPRSAIHTPFVLLRFFICTPPELKF